MYIPSWLILAAAIIAVLYFLRHKNQSTQSVSGLLRGKDNFSYKLEIFISPGWPQIYQTLAKLQTDKGFEKEIEKKKLDPQFDLWPRRYIFTEYYDSASGLTSRFQQTVFGDDSTRLKEVEEFGDSGYIFQVDRFENLLQDEKKYRERQKLAIEVGEDFIRTNIFDPHVGGMKSTGLDYEQTDYLFQFPLFAVFNFLLQLGQRFHDTENNPVVKWPEHIENKLKEMGVKYAPQFEYEPKLFDIKKHDKDFFERMGKPQIALYGLSQLDSVYFECEKTETIYNVKLKIFRPDENDRISLVDYYKKKER